MGAVVYTLWLIVFFLARSTGPLQVGPALITWSASGFFIVTFQVIALAIFHVEVGKRQRGIVKAMAWSGFVKDTTIYAVIALFIGSGLVKFENVLGVLSESARWHAFGWFAIAAIAVAIPALGLDVVFAERVVLQPEWKKVWRQEWQRRSIHQHVYVRDFVILVPGIIIMFAWVLVRIGRQSSSG
jgi:hypothetical protein